MKKSVLYLALVGAVAMALPSCNKERSESQKPEYISVSTNIGGMSRVTADGEGNQVFEVGDEISVYAWTGDKNAAPAAADRVVDNSINKLETGSKWVAPTLPIGFGKFCDRFVSVAELVEATIQR